MSPKKKKIASAHLQQIISPGANMSGTVLYIPFDRVAQRMRFPTGFSVDPQQPCHCESRDKRTTRLFPIAGHALLAGHGRLPSFSPSIRFPVNATLKMSRFPM
jgi:hypothetical protein